MAHSTLLSEKKKKEKSECISGWVESDPMDCNQPGSSVHGFLQARILEWVSHSLPGDLADPGIEPGSIASRYFTFWATRESPSLNHYLRMSIPGAQVFKLCLEKWSQRVFPLLDSGSPNTVVWGPGNKPDLLGFLLLIYLSRMVQKGSVNREAES